MALPAAGPVRPRAPAPYVVPVGYPNSDVPMAKPTQDWQGEHASYPLGVSRKQPLWISGWDTDIKDAANGRSPAG
jgi:hypothetical protein